MIKSLLTMQKQEREDFSVSKNVQQSIPIQRIWDDGIFLVGKNKKNKYSFTYKFSDINYAVASK